MFDFQNMLRDPRLTSAAVVFLHDTFAVAGELMVLDNPID